MTFKRLFIRYMIKQTGLHEFMCTGEKSLRLVFCRYPHKIYYNNNNASETQEQNETCETQEQNETYMSSRYVHVQGNAISY
jgi:tRNA splicing ligase